MPDVNLPNLLRQHAGGQRSVSVEGATIGEILEALQGEYPGMAGQLVTADGELHKFVNVYLNDDDVRYMDKLDTEVHAGDTISILPAVAGGDE
ncbi:MAG: ubiquitin-like small modifier protein 1 [Acidimicrobiales bacterium]